MANRMSRPISELLDQAAYLIDEVEALKPLITRMPDDVLEARLPPSERSVKDYYGAMIEIGARAMEAVRNPDAADTDGWPDLQDARLSRDWNRRAIRSILEELQEDRRLFLEVAASAEPTDVVEVTLTRVVAFDLACQQMVGERLFDVQPAPRIPRSDGGL